MTVLLGDSEKLQRLANEVGRVCRRKLKVNLGKSRVMRITKNSGNERFIRLEGGNMEEVNVFRNLGVDLSANGSMKDDINHRTDER